MFFINPERRGERRIYLKKALLTVVFLLFVFSSLVQGYAEQDLWILEVIVNEDTSNRQILDALVLGEEVYLPVVPVANLLEIPLKTAPDRYTFEHPASGQEVIIDKSNLVILLNNREVADCGIIYLFSGRLFVELACLQEIMDVSFEYEPTRLAVYANYHHFKEKVTTEEPPASKVTEEVEDKEPVTPFTISNITYDLNSNWSRDISAGGIPPDEQQEIVRDDWGIGLNLNARGTIYDWKYLIGLNSSLAKDKELELGLGNSCLIYDMDRASFQVGKLNVYSEEELYLKNSNYYGVLLVSSRSPLMNYNTNLIQVTGKAPAGSSVTLFINGWESREQTIGGDERYLFKDVLLFSLERANEVKVVIEKPAGEIEEVYRYIAVADSLLKKGEINYLAQLGKLYNNETGGYEADEGYIYNIIVNWGVAEKSTLGFSSYGEISDSNYWYNYNSLRLNQSLNDLFTLQGLLYHNHSFSNDIAEADLGYKVNLDYKSSLTQTGVEYHREAEQLNLSAEERFPPNKVVKLYYIHDLTPASLISGTYTYYSELDDPDQQENKYEVGYLVEKDSWTGALEYNKTINKGHQETTSDYWGGSVSYLIKPNIEVINELGYEVLWDEVFSQTLDYGIEGKINSGENTYIVRTNWSNYLTSGKNNTDYYLSWSKRWQLADNEYIYSELGYEYNTADESTSIPLGIKYSHLLNNDAKINLKYQGTWNRNDLIEGEIVHEIGLSITGAFNFFGGKLISTSPYLFAEEVGIVTGVVYNDKNRNGQFDSDETLLPGIPVCLDHQVVFTDQKGKFIFKEVTAGKYKLGVDLAQLPIEYTPTIQEKNIIVEANGAVEENIGVYVVGVVDGILKTANYEQEISLNSIKITAEPGGHSAFTDYRGYYYFDQLPAGKYTIKIEESSLPEWAYIDTEQEYEALITGKGEYISDINFQIYLKDEYLNKLDEKEEVKVEIEKITVEEEPFPESQVLEDILKIDLENKRAYYNGEEVILEPFVFTDDKLWTPIRAIAEYFGAEVFWDYQQKEVYIVDGDNNVLFNIKLGYALKDGESFELQGIQLKDGYTFVTAEDLSLIGLDYLLEEGILFLRKEK